MAKKEGLNSSFMYERGAEEDERQASARACFLITNRRWRRTAWCAFACWCHMCDTRVGFEADRLRVAIDDDACQALDGGVDAACGWERQAVVLQSRRRPAEQRQRQQRQERLPRQELDKRQRWKVHSAPMAHRFAWRWQWRRRQRRLPQQHQLSLPPSRRIRRFPPSLPLHHCSPHAHLRCGRAAAGNRSACIRCSSRSDH